MLLQELVITNLTELGCMNDQVACVTPLKSTQNYLGGAKFNLLAACIYELFYKQSVVWNDYGKKKQHQST